MLSATVLWGQEWLGPQRGLSVCGGQAGSSGSCATPLCLLLPHWLLPRGKHVSSWVMFSKAWDILIYHVTPQSLCGFLLSYRS